LIFSRIGVIRFYGLIKQRSRVGSSRVHVAVRFRATVRLKRVSQYASNKKIVQFTNCCDEDAPLPVLRRIDGENTGVGGKTKPARIWFSPLLPLSLSFAVEGWDVEWRGGG